MVLLMSILKWGIKNPLFSITILSLISVSVYAGTQKIGKMRVEIKLEAAKTKLLKCSSALQSQSDKVIALGEERDRLMGDLDVARLEAEEVLIDAEVRIEALLNEAKASDCTGNLKRFSKQLEGVRW